MNPDPSAESGSQTGTPEESSLHKEDLMYENRHNNHSDLLSPLYVTRTWLTVGEVVVSLQQEELMIGEMEGVEKYLPEHKHYNPRRL